MSIGAEEAKKLKRRGIVLCRDGEHFIARIVTKNGVLSSEQMAALSEAARRYGDGRVALSVRMSVELQGIAYENIEPMCDYLADYELYSGGTGAKIRPIVCCKGTVCVHGLFDTQGLAEKLYEHYYLGWRNTALPHKFKIAVGGCPNNCVKPALNDFSVTGQRVPAYDPQLCRRCGKCQVELRCPMKICHRPEDGVMQRAAEKCTNCGKCIDACPFHALTEKAVGLRIQLGGLWGKQQRLGTPLPGIYTEQEVFSLLDRTLLLWKQEGNAGERFGQYLDRVGFEAFTQKLFETTL